MEKAIKGTKSDAKRTWIKALLFSLLGIFLFLAVQRIFTPDFSYYENTNRNISGIRYLDDDTVDVVFFGTSHAEFGISPIELYRDTRICSYNLASSGQPLEASYYLMKDMFSYQRPAVVTIDASGLFQNGTNYILGWRYVLDNFSNNVIKLEAARAYEESGYSDGAISGIFPIVEYHERWDELGKEDFLPKGGDEYYSLGQYLYSPVVGTNATYEDIYSAEALLQKDADSAYYEDGKVHTDIISEHLYVPRVSDEKQEYLLKMKKLCEENGAQLVLEKVPVKEYPQRYSGYWTEQRSDAVREIAERYDIPFVDFQCDMDIGLDWQVDTSDAGAHLNIRGASKVTAAMGKYLLENFALRRQSNPQYDEYEEYYNKIMNVAMLQSETDFNAYIQRLKDNADLLAICIASQDEYTSGMDDAAYSQLEDLGLQLIRQGAYRDAYAAVIDRGGLVYEAVSGRVIDHDEDVNGLSVTVSSVGWYTEGYTDSCSIEIDGTDHACGGRGLSIVVYDYESGLVVDSVTFDTFSPSRKSTRDWGAINDYLRAYEAAVCFGENAA